MVNYSQNTDKTLSRAIPILNENGIVKTWELEVVYSYPSVGYATSNEPLRRKYQHTEDVEYLNKTPYEFTKTELLSFMNILQYDSVFDSTYESLFFPPVIIKDTSFDINSLSE